MTSVFLMVSLTDFKILILWHVLEDGQHCLLLYKYSFMSVFVVYFYF